LQLGKLVVAAVAQKAFCLAPNGYSMARDLAAHAAARRPTASPTLA
jgi:hypothetical protein